ncbi:MAG: SMC-Scp complex subunit ScpB [Clostridiales bacterium]|jgi:segregation and condensation protein B|nr:SMC-Scp complex subunit ScpB [Clostridiales bacterium]
MREEAKVLEALLFASGEAVSVSALGEAAGLDTQTAQAILDSLAEEYLRENRGFQLRQINGTVQLCSNPFYYEAVRRLVQTPVKKTLTQPIMETLSIIAYKQPVTKAQIEEIRGVAADHAVNRLIEYGLVMEQGRLDAPGKPILLCTTDAFLRYFGFEHLGQLPMPEMDPASP